MTDTQILTLAITIIVPLSLLLYSNTRISEVKDTLRADIKRLEEKQDVHIKRLEEKLGLQIQRLEEKQDAHFNHMEMRLKLHELEHHDKK